MARKKRLTITHENDVTRLDMGPMEIWDGADLALLRETLTQLVEGDDCRSIGISMESVKYIPSGFFGMLYDWHDRGVAIQLYTPQPNVLNMLWFRKFFSETQPGCHHLVNATDDAGVGEPAWAADEPAPAEATRSLEESKQISM